MVQITITRNTAIAVLGLIIMGAIIWMMTQTRHTTPYLTTRLEGFTSNSNQTSTLSNYGYVDPENNSKRELFGNTDNGHKSKLSRLLSKSKVNKRHKSNGKQRDREAYTNVLKWLNDDDDEEGPDSGKYDNFQDVLDEIDRIDVTAFGINSMGNTIRRYSKNIDNRLKYAHKKNKNSRLDASMAQLSVLGDEFRKLFAIDKLL